jgi:hypothetical protein
MRTHVRRLLVCAPVLALAVAFLAGAGLRGQGKDAIWKPILPDDAYKELVARANKDIAEGLNAKPFDEDEAAKVQFNALLVAAYNLSSAKGDKQLAATALKLADVLKNPKKVAEAKQLAADLAAGKAAPGVQFKLEPMSTYVEDKGVIMAHYKTKEKGGEGLPPALQFNIRLKNKFNGVEELISELDKKKLTPANLSKGKEELILMAYKAAVHGVITHDYAPARPVKGKAPKLWLEHSVQMRDAAIDLAEAVRKGDVEAVQRTAKRLNSSCLQCHSDFRSSS